MMLLCGLILALKREYLIKQFSCDVIFHSEHREFCNFLMEVSLQGCPLI